MALVLSELARLAEGKTKVVLQHPEKADQVVVQQKDTITAGDGAKRDAIPGKGALAAECCVHAFELLEANGVPTHYIGPVKDDRTTIVARRLDMMPIELVARRIATGSYLKRNPAVPDGHRFDKVVLEMFYKDDANHDPIMVANIRRGGFDLHDAKLPITKESRVGFVTFDEVFHGYGEFPNQTIEELEELTRRSFLALESAFARIGLTLWDFKIECGVDDDEVLRVGDDLIPDSWRAKTADGRQISKQVYREGGSVEEMLAVYGEVVELMRRPEFMKLVA